MKHVLVLFLAVCAGTPALAVAIAPGTTVSENFSIGTSATASLPTDWKTDKNDTVRTVGTYAGAGSATQYREGDNMSSSAANGIYNFGAGDAGTATDRAVGGISSSGGSKSVNVYVRLTNSGAAIDSFTISYSVEKYRNGSNSAGFRMQMYYSTDGTSWTSAGTDFESAWAADANNNGFASAPGATLSVVNKTLAVNVATGNTLYLAWNYSVRSGTTTTSAQALGLDDVSITAVGSSTDAVATNNVFLLTPTAQPALTTAPNASVTFVTKSWSNGTAQIGYGADDHGTDWTWVDATITNSAVGNYVATAAVAFVTADTYYYATRWNTAGVVYYATNAAGQINLASLAGGAWHRVVVTNASTPDVSVATNMRVMAANVSSGSNQEYLGPGVRIFQALQPDIVCIQEFNVTDATVRAFVNRVFGPEFQYICEPGMSIPNGIISRWPIIASGVWEAADAYYADRNYVWATIDIPGPTNLHAVSVHLSTDIAERPGEAMALTNYIRKSFNTNEYIVLAGDINPDSDSETALTILKTILSDAYQPADTNGDKDTNEPRSSRYDFVLPNAALNKLHTTTTVAGVNFPAGIVFDTRTWSGSPPAPTLVADSENSTGEHFNMQHMGVLKTFAGVVPPTPPSTATNVATIWKFTNGVTSASAGGTFACASGISTSWVASAGVGADGDTALCADGFSTNDLSRYLTFRVIGTNAIGSELYLDTVRIGYAFPEPIAPALTLATVMALSRRGMAQQR
jgi:endonuclease/exonuclease/phosphatase family metal-dependent hydrolase